MVDSRVETGRISLEDPAVPSKSGNTQKNKTLLNVKRTQEQFKELQWPNLTNLHNKITCYSL